ncbi:hypothetical protein [Winogradskyella flava]|uniref:hypothetical protein n=1 Tax=Winogradskyella flava TaxID=1884876 RepID=UPI0024918213|nr:hypothetical protein [Winogradskyella flava]
MNTNKPYIEFRKNSDFSGILTDTFGFIRNEFKPFTKSIFNIAGPAILVFMLSLAVYNYVAGDIFDFTNYEQPGFNGSSVMLTLIAAIVYLLSAIAAYIFTGASALYYIKSYVDNKGNTDILEIKKNVYRSFWSFFGIGFLKGMTLLVAICLCFLPVFYAMVPMAIVFSIYVFEPRQSTTDAYSKSFNLVNVDFWTAFGTYIVLFIIFYILSFVFAIPSAIYTLIGTGIFSGEVDPANMNDFYQDPILILLNVLNTFFQFFLNIILVVGGAAIYFHLHEKANFTGTYERISEIGKTED